MNDNNLPKVTFGFVNCNRLFYLKSCVESFIETTEDYPNKEIIVVDNASAEENTEEYLRELDQRGVLVLRQDERDPSNEYAKALNLIAEHATGNFVAPIPADMQFVVRGQWLHEYINFFLKYKDHVGCISFDAQRRVRNIAGVYSNILGDGKMKFLLHFNRNPVMGACNCLLSREMLDKMYPWDTNNQSHAGGQDSETKMLHKVNEIIQKENLSVSYAAPAIPVSAAIFNEDGGTARVRDNKRYGKYVQSADGIHYYKIHEFDHLIDEYGHLEVPTSIEDVAEAIDWNLPLDSNGDWIKLKGVQEIYQEL
tara:strand:+ start:194 stop:1123 length:930 start_codon:yes stop_codon:yes gene_type:complete